ncbi:MAG: GGDEF domain-containing protein [Gemmatimonadetes bacterium]|nr:GGDEF domain-containing protein [Gemmatimonadota bacterium]
MRRSDLVARYGGEEFVVILHDTTAEQALERLEQMRHLVSREDVLPDRAEPTRMTVSIGVADRPHDGETALDIVAEADRRLFAAKEAGRNRVVGPPRSAPALARGA